MSLFNCYNALPKKYRPREYYNPNRLMPSHPYRLCIVGASNTGKTNILMNIIELSKNFLKIYLYAKKLDESLYQYLIDEWKKRAEDIITVSNNVDDIVDINDINENIQNLIIFDDFVVEKNLGKVSELFIRGRKSNCSIVFISQTYFGIPTEIRINSDYFIFTKNLKGNDLINIAKDHSGCLSINEFKRLYRLATRDGYNFFMIDLKTCDETLKFRKNFDFSLVTKSKLDNNESIRTNITEK